MLKNFTIPHTILINNGTDSEEVKSKILVSVSLLSEYLIKKLPEGKFEVIAGPAGIKPGYIVTERDVLEFCQLAYKNCSFNLLVNSLTVLSAKPLNGHELNLNGLFWSDLREVVGQCKYESPEEMLEDITMREMDLTDLPF